MESFDQILLSFQFPSQKLIHKQEKEIDQNALDLFKQI